jgi:hypothetical protein
VVKIIAESLSQHDEKYVVLTPLSGITVGGRKGHYFIKGTMIVTQLSCCMDQSAGPLR